MRILYIDQMTPYGHINFNQIYISGLLKAGAELSIVCSKEYVDKLDLPSAIVALVYPKFLSHVNKGGIRDRIIFFLRLIYIRFFLDLSAYDMLLFSSYEELSFYCGMIRQRSFLINHANIQGFASNSIKRYFAKKISKKNVQIVFNDVMKRKLQEWSIENVIVCPHGFSKPYSLDKLEKTSIYRIARIPDDVKIDRVIFSPSFYSSDFDFINTILCSESFQTFLEDSNIVLLIKGVALNNISNRIYFIDNYLSSEDYKLLFMNSDFILLCYGSDFSYRVSGVLFECMINNKICLIKNSLELRGYSNYICYDPYFVDVEDLKRKIALLSSCSLKKRYNIDDLYPDFYKFLEECQQFLKR